MPTHTPERPDRPGRSARHDRAPRSIDDLPSPDTKRCVIRRKAQVVAGVRSGLISLEVACRRYKLSIEEFLSWQQMIDNHGMRGLRVTRLQDYRSHRSEDGSTPNAQND
jgi:hypothetical protein